MSRQYLLQQILRNRAPRPIRAPLEAFCARSPLRSTNTRMLSLECLLDGPLAFSNFLAASREPGADFVAESQRTGQESGRIINDMIPRRREPGIWSGTAGLRMSCRFGSGGPECIDDSGRESPCDPGLIGWRPFDDRLGALDRGNPLNGDGGVLERLVGVSVGPTPVRIWSRAPVKAKRLHRPTAGMLRVRRADFSGSGFERESP
jgi:hypothetical protein